MYLKSIEVNGFKSFANKIDFRFNQGITGIVGPNGSGKSNVADAVRWVLGEQSASKLRGSKMEDVIFSGTELRKPQGAAYVAITLDNSDHSLAIDFNEVTVARRVYRSGESEYLINGNVSRLKDVTSLFFDTGIGKEGYSIIGQGQVERILSDKPDDRRALFDEAVGIVKYKKNKQLTEKQLDAEHQNLNRVNDILSGLENRVEPLRLQSEKAKEYLTLKDELKRYEVSSFLIEIDDIREKLKKNQEDLKITEEDKLRLEKEFEFTKQEYDKLEADLEELNFSIDEVKDVINQTNVELERADGEKRVIEEKISSEKSRNLEIDNQIAGFAEEIKKLEADQAKIQEKLDSQDDSVEEKKKKVAEIEAARDEVEAKEQNLEHSINDANTEIIDIINERGSLKEKIARYDAMLENINLRRTELSSSFLSSTSEQKRLESETARITDQHTSVKESLERNQSQLNKTETDLRSATDRSNELKSEIGRLNSQLISLKSRYENLRNLSERYDGYGNSIKKVMEKKGSNKKVIGVVADIIEVEKEYETAIETALGGSIQNIVTEDEDTAKSMIAYLRENKLGRATFLPISTVKGRGSVSQEALSEPGVIGVASKLVKTDAKFSGLMDSLLGRSIVVENIDYAIKIQRKYNQSLRLVTIHGDLMNPGGAMTGGAFKNSSNLLGRKRELDDIDDKIKETSVILSKSTQEEASLSMKRESLKEQRANLTREIQRLSIDENSLMMSLRSMKEKSDDLDITFASIKRENTELDNQVETINKNKEELFNHDKDNDNEVSARQKLIDQREKDLAQVRDERRNIEEKLRTALSESNASLQQADFLKRDVDRMSSDIERYKSNIKESENRKESGLLAIEELTKSLTELETTRLTGTNTVAEKSQELEVLNQKKDEINQSHKDFFAKREKLSTDINGLEKAAMSLNMKIEKQEEAKDNLSNYMWEEYELTYSSAESIRDPELTNPTEIKKHTADVKKSIKGLGDVNVNAIEEYKEVAERYEFLKTQHDDIVEAENNLRGIIADLDRQMKETFKEKFQEIQTMFSKVFKELFGGGKASLALVDEDDILETGIIINAQPPGKKLQNMMQLSGGEKSLSAIALLFAIQSLKPSPFCILDEIEAALDDSNVNRFAGYLNKLTKHTQFIVVTHRKGTMEAADRLYGITMQEKGVSTLVSVNLIEDSLTN